MLYKTILKWIGLVALCLGMVYTVYHMGYKFGFADATSKSQVEKLKIQELNLELSEKLKREEASIVKDITEATTKLHEKVYDLRYKIDKLTADILAGGLRNDLKRRDVPNTDSASGDNGTSSCGLHERDVKDIIDITRRADETAEQLTACQGVIRAWTKLKR